MNRLYEESGYISASDLIDCKPPWVWACGGRGIGKTYGVIKELLNRGKKFILLRKSQVMADSVSTPELSPFKPVIADTGIELRYRTVTGVTIAYRVDTDTPQDVCMILALSTIANRRGIDATDYEYLIYDEFISEQHENVRIKDEYRAFENAYETLNRNRELQGKPPLKVIALANAFDLGNPYFMGMRIITPVYRMMQNNQESITFPDRGIRVVVYRKSPISDLKSKTQLYKVNQGSEYNRFALKNEFVYDDRLTIKSMPIKEFKALVGLGELAIYKHKSERLYYVTEYKQGSIQPYYDSRPSDLMRFMRRYLYLYDLLYTDKLVFEKYEYQRLFQLYCS